MKNQFINNMSECLIATTSDRITRHAKEYHWTLSFVIKTARQKVIVVKKAHSDFPELWVSSKYRNYRQAFIKYIAQFFSVTDSISPSQHVDHIMPISRFRNKYPQYFIRLFLLDKKMNCSFGAGYEKNLNQFESKKRTQWRVSSRWNNSIKAIRNKNSQKKFHSRWQRKVGERNCTFIRK